MAERMWIGGRTRDSGSALADVEETAPRQHAGNVGGTAPSVPARSFDLHEWVDILRRQSAVIVISVVVAGAAGGLSAWDAPVQFQATTVVLTQPRSGNTQDGGDISAYIDPNRFITTEVQVGQSDLIRTLAARDLGLAPTALPPVTVVPASEANVLMFTTIASDATVARDAADAFAAAYINNRRTELTVRMSQTVDELDQRITALQIELDKVDYLLSRDAFNPAHQSRERSLVARITTLSQSNDQLRIYLSARNAGASVLSPAVLPTAPLGSPIPRAIALGALVGLILGIVLAIVRDMLDHRIRSRRSLEAASGARTLCTVPTRGSRSFRREVARLRAVLDAQGRAGDASAIVFSPAVVDRGVAHLVGAIGESVARSGVRAVLIDGDLSDPALGRMFAVLEGPGLSEVLRGDVEPVDALYATPTERLLVMPAGGHAEAAADVVMRPGRERMVEALRVHGTVLVRAAAANSTIEPALIAGSRSAVVLLVRYGTTTTNEVDDAVEGIELAGGRLLGTVLYDAPPARGNREWVPRFLRRRPVPVSGV